VTGPDELRLTQHRQPPSTPTERILVEIWCDVLELDEVGVLDNFSEAGGYSLLLHVVRDRIEQRMDLRPDMAELFEYPTIRALGRFLDGARAANEIDTPDDERRANAHSRLSRLRNQRIQGMNNIHDSNG
jgi:phosphopantetheine binding protein